MTTRMTTRSLPATVAIDGPAAAGKTMLGRALADRLGYFFLDTGLMYRAFALAALRRGVPPADADRCAALAASLDLRVEGGPETRILLGDEDVTALLRSPEVEVSVSPYSAIPAVRAAMVARQRELASAGRVVVAGRDIGTVVLPDAPVKLYLAASEDERARRRSEQSGAWGASQGHDQARRDIAGRDVVDAGRATSPLRPADDAIVIDTTGMTPEEVIAVALEEIRCATG